MKTIRIIIQGLTTLPVLSFAGVAAAQEPPALIGNYSANVEGAINPGNPAHGSFAVSFGYQTKERVLEPAPAGNYSANVRISDVRGR